MIDVKLSNIRSSPHHFEIRKNEQWIEQNVVYTTDGSPSVRPSTNTCDHQPVWSGPRTAWALQISGRTRSLILIWLLGWPDRRRGDRRISPGMWLLRAVKGWISIHHRSFSVALHLSVWFRQTVCQEYANLGVLLEEVDEPLGVPMDKRMGWFPVVVTGIKAPPLT